MTRSRAVMWGAVVLRIVIGAVLVYASVSKIIHPDQFADAVANYRILPPVLVSWTAIILPWLELITGVCLILGVAVAGAALVSLVLFVVFAGALVSVQARHLDIACGCFSLSGSTGDGGHSLWISVALIVGSLGVLLAGDRASHLSIAKLGVWSEKTRRRVPLAIGAVLAVLLVVTVIASVTGRHSADAAVAQGGDAAIAEGADAAVAEGGPMTLLARRELASEESLAAFRAAQPAIEVRVVKAKLAASVLELLESGTRPDVVECRLDQVPWLVQQGYIQPLDPARVPAWSNVPAALLDFPGLSVDGATYAAPLNRDEIGILYRTDLVQSVPTSFRDVFAARYRGRAAIENDANTGIRLGAAVLGLAGGPELSTATVKQATRFLKTKESQFAAYYQDAYQLEGLFLTGTVDIAVGDRATARKLADAGVPVAFAVPKEGLLVRVRALAIATDCLDLDAAYSLISYSMEAAAASPAAGAQPAVAADALLVTAPSSWESWSEVFREVVPPEAAG